MQYNMQISLFRCNNHTFLSLLVCVPYIIGCNIADTLRRAASHIISNYNYLCSVPPYSWRRGVILRTNYNEIHFCLCGVPCALFRTLCSMLKT